MALAKRKTVKEKLWELLSDGRQHAMSEMHDCLWDELGEDKDNSVNVHITGLRKELRPRGMDVVRRNGWFQLVRLIQN